MSLVGGAIPAPEVVPMYTPPGRMGDARDGWWNWILEVYSSNRAEATNIVVDMCQEL